MSPDLRWLAFSFAAVILMPTRALSGTPGDSFDAPFVIEALPFVTTGSTCGYEDDTIYLCGNPVAAPDVVYRFVPDHDMTITLSTCGSSEVHARKGGARAGG